MRAPHEAAVCAALLTAATLVLSSSSEEGYNAEDAYLDDPIDIEDNSTACPTDKLLRSRETCQVDGAGVQCIRLHCCDDYVYIAGRCIPKSVDPCSLQLCEQACAVKGERVWCTCHPGFRFHADNYRRKTQPYCVDVDECLEKNGGCEQRCVNDPGGFHCDCSPPYSLARDGRTCERAIPIAIPEPLALIRASSRCYATCDTVSWLTRKVKQLSDHLHMTQTALKKLMENPALRGGDEDRFAEGTRTNRVLDSIVPLEGGYCRCERGPRGPAGPPGMEGPKGDMGPRGPRGHRGPKGSLDLMLLLLADVRHDIRNLEARVYKEGEQPERFNLQKAWKRQRKQEKLELESKVEQDLEAYTAPSIERTDGPVEISPNGVTGEIPHDSTTDHSTDKLLVKGETDEPSLVLPLGLPDIDDKLRQFQLLANATRTEDEEEPDTDYDYSFY